jgi:hypothetical protein
VQEQEVPEANEEVGEDLPSSEGVAIDAASTLVGRDDVGCLVGGELDVTRDPSPQRGRPTRSVDGG